MKNIFKKNQIIITALAIMIAIAGYLSFTNNDKPEDKGSIEATNPDLEDYDVLTQLEDGMEVAVDDTTDTTGTDDVTTADGNPDATDVEDTAEDLSDDTLIDGDTNANGNDTETTSEDLEDTNTDDADTESDTEELGDISDDDLLETAQNVTDNGELETDEEGVPGEAVLASTHLDAGFFISSKLEREQTRAMNRETLMQIIESTTISEAAKEDAINKMIEMTAIAETENNTERMLEAKGFDGAIVSILNGKVDVVVNAESLSDQQLAIIESVVKSKTDIAAEHITINPVVLVE